MFRKPFVVKKNVNLRNSETRRLISRIPAAYADTVDKKAQIAHVKLVSFNGTAVNTYTFDKVPLFFDFDPAGVLYPTVYYLWLAPTSYPVLVVHEQTFQYLENGADLMLPGVVRSKLDFPQFPKHAAVTICLYSNGKLVGPVAVGTALMSSQDMIANSFQGKGVQIQHVYRDQLWEFGTRGGPPSFELEEFCKSKIEGTLDVDCAEDFPALGSNSEQKASEVDIPVDGANDVGGPDSSEPSVNDKPDAQTAEEEPMEDLLYRCFIAGLKYRLTKSTALPIDVGQFYAQYLLACVPPARRLDMKKTKFKKFGVFLDEINKSEDGKVVGIKSKGKGADVISEVNWSHPAIRSFELTDEKITDEDKGSGKPGIGPSITEYFAVTESVISLFKSIVRVSKGDLYEPSGVREVITSYVKTQNLTAGKSVRLDPILTSLTKLPGEVVDWNTLMQKIQAKMTKTFVLRMPDGRELVRKVNMPKITFKVESRSGNKKVTLVNNIAVFGLIAKELCHRIQVGVATSATMANEAVNCEGPQITVQGNQVAFVGELLMNEYGINKKYIDGLDLAPKRKR